jgi:hypothetical protein
MKWFEKNTLVVAMFLAVLGIAASPHASAQEKKPNIVFIIWVTT